MKIIVGLGNPGREYEATRHNIGFMVVEQLARTLGISTGRTKERALVAESQVKGEKVLLVKPLTYMNLSGEAVGALLRWYKLDPADLIVIHDDLDLPPGKLRIRQQGGPGGHNGIKSIIRLLGTEKFVRIKLGIGRPHPGQESADYVLNRFNAEERDLIGEAVAKGAEAVLYLLENGPVAAANLYNGG